MSRFKTPGPRMTELLRAAGSPDLNVARAALHQLAKALTLPLQQGVLKGDIVSDIFQYEKFAPGVAVEYPLDLLRPGTEDEHVAYTIPAQGRIPERHTEGDYVMVPTYEIGSSIDFALKYAREARWNVVSRALQVLEGSFVRKTNSDGWRVILSAAYGRFLTVYDDLVGPKFFSKRLVELMKNIMRRQAGGNSSSVNRGKLSRLYTSPEAMGDVRGWDTTQVDPFTRRDIFLSEDMDAMKIFGVEVRSIDELGVGQEFQSYFEDRLGGSMPTYTYEDESVEKAEIVVGLDLTDEGSFMNPVKEDVQIFEDPTFHRQRRASLYGFGEMGWLVSNQRDVLLGAI
jgi:hypothetical protein